MQFWHTCGKVPTDQRTTPEALDAFQFGDALAALLPAEQARDAAASLTSWACV